MTWTYHENEEEGKHWCHGHGEWIRTAYFQYGSIICLSCAEELAQSVIDKWCEDYEVEEAEE